MIWLKQMEKTDEEQFTIFEKRYKAECGNEVVPISLNNRNLTFDEFWQEISAMGDEKTCPKGFVPAKYFLIMDEQKIVGAINLRYKDNENILTRAGHIGYGVAPWERGKGYATEALKICLQKAWWIGMDRVILTTDLNNAASQRVILKNGGVYDKTVGDKKLFCFDTLTDVAYEQSAMAVVLCKGKLLTTVENVYGRDALSLPKGHLEQGETEIDTAIRECYEETDVRLLKSEVVAKLTPFSIRFVDHHGTKVCKTITPILFEIQSERIPVAKEERIVDIRYMPAAEFAEKCSYDNVRAVVEEAKGFVKI